MAETRYELSQLAREMARSLASVVAERQARTEELISAIDATPEQQAAITEILRSAAEQSMRQDRSNPTSPSREARAESMTKIFALLTPDQRRKLRDFLREP